MNNLIFVLLISLSVSVTAQSGSKEKIYSSFTIVNDGLEATRSLLAKETNKQYFDLIKEKGKDSIVVDLSDSLRFNSSELVSYINHMKVLLIIKTEKLDKKVVVENDTIISLKYLDHFDDYYTPGEVLLGEDEWKYIKGKYTAKGLKIEIDAYQDFIKEKCYKNKKNHQTYINLSNSGYYGNWERANFKEKPLAGIITYLSKLQLDIMLTEKQTINHLLELKSE
jgi:hypothetical protein